MKTQQLLTVKGAASKVGVSPDTMRRWADAGLLLSFRLPSGHRRFDPAVVEAFAHGLRERGSDGGELAWFTRPGAK